MKIAVFGGSGFVGSYLVEELLNAGHDPIVLVRNPEKAEFIRDSVKVVGDFFNTSDILRVIKNADAVIYLVGIIREFPKRKITFEELHFISARRIMNLALKCGIERFILMSALGVNSFGTPYQKTKFLAEQYLKFTGLKYTIIRPSVIFGDPRSKFEFCTQLKKQLIDIPLPAPAFFKGLNFIRAGKFNFAPVHVKDVSRIIVKALEHDDAVGKIMELGGPDVFSWNQILKMIASAAGKSKWLIPVPVWGPEIAAFFLDRFLWFPVNRHQLIMLVEGSSCDSSALFDTYGIKAIPFNNENLLYLNQ